MFPPAGERCSHLQVRDVPTCRWEMFPPCYRRWLALHSDAKREVPEISEITENPEVLLYDLWLRTPRFSYLSLTFPFPLLFAPHCLSPLLFSSLFVTTIYCSFHTIGSTGLLVLLSWLLLSCLLIVLAYYTTLNWHSIYSSTFSLYDSLSRVSCLSWQSTRS